MRQREWPASGKGGSGGGASLGDTKIALFGPKCPHKDQPRLTGFGSVSDSQKDGLKKPEKDPKTLPEGDKSG